MAWDETPEGYEEASRERIFFRVYGADSVTAVIGVLQNSCLSGAYAIKFRSLGGGKVSVYRAGWSTISNMSSGGGTLRSGLTASLTKAGVSDADLIELLDHAEYRFAHACETVVFGGDPDEPNNLVDVVLDVVWFGPAP